jgi:hypothetical protein
VTGHGVNRYMNLRCRCVECKQANARYKRERKAATRSTSVGLYLPVPAAEMLRAGASRRGLSMSRYVQALVEADVEKAAVA